jgi:hypothetical protein
LKATRNLYTTRAHVTQLFVKPIKTFWFSIFRLVFPYYWRESICQSLLFAMIAVLGSKLCHRTS